MEAFSNLAVFSISLLRSRYARRTGHLETPRVVGMVCVEVDIEAETWQKKGKADTEDGKHNRYRSSKGYKHFTNRTDRSDPPFTLHESDREIRSPFHTSDRSDPHFTVHESDKLDPHFTDRKDRSDPPKS